MDTGSSSTSESSSSCEPSLETTQHEVPKIDHIEVSYPPKSDKIDDTTANNAKVV